MKHASNRQGFWLLLGWLLASVAHAGELDGSLAWGERVAIGTLVSGNVTQVAVQPGQRVARGELLLELDARGFRAEVNGARAELARAEVLLEEAQREDERAEELYERTVLSEHERTQAVIGLRQAEAEQQRARASLVAAQLAAERARLRAPFDGLVLTVNAATGQTVQSSLRSETLVEMAGDTQMRVLAQTTLAQAREIEKAGQVNVRVAGQQVAGEGVLVGLEPSGNSAEGALYSVSVSFRRPADLLLRAGEPAQLSW